MFGPNFAYIMTRGWKSFHSFLFRLRWRKSDEHILTPLRYRDFLKYMDRKSLLYFLELQTRFYTKCPRPGLN